MLIVDKGSVVVGVLVVVMVLFAVLLLIVALLLVAVLGLGFGFAHDDEALVLKLLDLLPPEFPGLFRRLRAALVVLPLFFELGLVLASFALSFSPLAVVVASVVAFSAVGSLSVVSGLVFSLSALLLFFSRLGGC